MENDIVCPICYKQYGEQPDGDFLCMDGIQNSEYGKYSNCRHWFCVDCINEIYLQDNYTVFCPLCREDITDWIFTHYPIP